jgi:hypothetical protein
MPKHRWDTYLRQVKAMVVDHFVRSVRHQSKNLPKHYEVLFTGSEIPSGPTELSQVQRDKRKLGTMCHALIAEHMFTPNLDTYTGDDVTEKVDILHHAQASLEGKPLALKHNIQVSDGLRNYFSKITDLMHRNLLSWFDDDLAIAKDMVENALELDNDRGRSGTVSCTCSPTVTSFMALNEYENLFASLSLQGKSEDAPRAHEMTRDSENQ